MREIKFSYMWQDGKSWLDLRYTLEQVEGGEVYEYFENEPLLRRFRLKARRQYTGKKDNTGKEVFEGDILKYLNGNCTGPVFWRNGGFETSCMGWGDEPLEDLDSYEIEIIGNIYENEDLLNDED